MTFRLAVIAAGIAVLVTSVAVGASQARTAATPYTYVALGDSFSSGEGVRPFLATSLGCHRSSRAYAAWVKPPGFAKPLYAIASTSKHADLGGTNTYGSGKSTRSAANVTWASRACSGAKTQNLLPASLGGVPQAGAGGMTQPDGVPLAKANLVTLTIGGNDLGYVNGLFTCALTNCATSAFERERTAQIEAVEPKLEAVYRTIAAKAPHARILVLGYPQIFPSEKSRQACAKLSLFQGKQDMLRRLGTRLNAALETAAGRAGARVEFVPVIDRFAGHEICGSKGAWLNALVMSGPGFSIDPGSFHPNLDGQRGYAAAVNDALTRAR